MVSSSHSSCPKFCFSTGSDLAELQLLGWSWNPSHPDPLIPLLSLLDSSRVSTFTQLILVLPLGGSSFAFSVCSLILAGTKFWIQQRLWSGIYFLLARADSHCVGDAAGEELQWFGAPRQAVSGLCGWLSDFQEGMDWLRRTEMLESFGMGGM